MRRRRGSHRGPVRRHAWRGHATARGAHTSTEPRHPADAFQRPLVPRIVGAILPLRYTDNARFLHCRRYVEQCPSKCTVTRCGNCVELPHHVAGCWTHVDVAHTELDATDPPVLRWASPRIGRERASRGFYPRAWACPFCLPRRRLRSETWRSHCRSATPSRNLTTANFCAQFFIALTHRWLKEP
jgi:hypothetical protein